MEYIRVIKIKYIVENTTDHNAKYKFQVEPLKQTLKPLSIVIFYNI